jgi:hypothetical protein
MDLYGNPTNLQGGSAAIQGGSPALQPAGNPQQAAGLYGPPSPQPAAPVRTTPTLAAPKPSYGAPVQTAQPDTQINSIFSSFIGSRPSPSNPGVLEYYNKQTGQRFSSADQLYSFASTLGAGPINSFTQLHAPVAQAQQPAYQQPAATPQQTVAQNSGTAGLSVDDYLKLIQQQNQLTPDQITKIQEGLGIPAAAQAAYAPPSQSTVDFYNSAYQSSGLNAVKQQIQTLNDQINKRQQDFVTAQSVLNENPFLSEASRVGRISRLNDKAQQEIGNLVNQQAQYQQLYQNGIGEVNNLVTAHTTDFTQNTSQNQAHLQFLLTQAATQSQATIAQSNQNALQYLPAYLQAKAKANPQQTVTSPTTGAIFRWDPATGTFQTVQGPTLPYTSTTGPDGTPTAFNPLTGQYGATFSGGSFPAGAQTPGSAAAVNNPLGIKPNGKFAQYATPDQGFQAGVDLVSRYINGTGPKNVNGNSTLSQMVNTWITGDPNNTRKTGYDANNVAQYLSQQGMPGVTASTPISQIDPAKLAAAIGHFETGYNAGTPSSSSANNQSSSPYAKDVRQTADGSQYLNSDTYSSADQKTAALNYARANGIAILNGAQSGALEGISQATLLLNQIQTDYQAIAAEQSTDLFKRYVENPFANASYYGDLGVKIAQYQADRTKAINLLKATAGGGGLRINEAEIAQATTNDLPDITLPLQAGLAKINSARNSLSTVQQSVLTSGGGKAPTSTNGNLPPLSSYNL